ncbi:hypothetical protein PTSG_10851 [Salpingoeca rosetta]|uniref:Uncharacterized protein n=1 Tax=Salpingoeca rosetta (strain ATCC 50818 / BSB-021) TaxID=946362 RepID=F2URK0_SALR5|nr:uncharacterized protein PTSG_10851 [Salpingoeca rosetta]EGD80169.1 hypothetical protein PTSG_10851 [Salpingoeca rosetta]|eukprot:XP_004988231.1 hypothetical protein PTSG_10851 [Salpingoeca rosetta]
MSGYEKSPLTGAELFPKRVESGSIHTLEKAVSYGTLLLAVAATGVCVAFGIQYHIQHLILGIVIILAAVHFYLLLRMYQKDELQERKLVYLGCLVVLALSIAGILYGVGWQTSDPFYGCDDGWFHKPTGAFPKGICSHTLPTAIVPAKSCYHAIGSGGAAQGEFQFQLLQGLANQTKKGITCAQAQQWIQTCTNTKEVSWKCPK